MFIVTGGAGFIGSNIVKALNEKGADSILVVDDLADGGKFANLADCHVADYLESAAFRDILKSGADLGPVEAVLHQGAITDTTARDGRAMMDANFAFPKEVFAWCATRGVPLVYASSAAVYGASGTFAEFSGAERPLNLYGWSKWMFDCWARPRLAGAGIPVVGLRYFNVYGPREAHKGRMASVIHHFSRQLSANGRVRLFEGSHGFADGEQRRDFVFVGDVVSVNLWAMEARVSGILNVGTGRARSFNEVARALIAREGKGTIDYIAFPEDLKGAYQAHTEADLGQLRAAGYAGAFRPIEDGIGATLGSGPA